MYPITNKDLSNIKIITKIKFSSSKGNNGNGEFT